MKPSSASTLEKRAGNDVPDVALSVEGVSASYGGAVALSNVSFQVVAGECAALIGSNGAGKTTTLRVISGVLKPVSGHVALFGEPIVGRTPPQIVRAGIAHCPEGRQLFADMTVRENLLLGAYVDRDRDRASNKLDEMFDLFPRVSERRDQLAGTLSGGEQQMVAICRALMSSPRVLLLDEPTLGLSPLMVEHVADMIDRIKATGITVVLVEQNARMALELSDHAQVLESGSVVVSGPSPQVEQDPLVQRAFLGI